MHQIAKYKQVLGFKNHYKHLLDWSQDKFLGGTWFLNLLFLIILLLWLFFKVKPSGSTVPLHYNVLLGVDITGTDRWLYGVVFLAFVILILNIFLGRRMYHVEKGAAYILAVGSLLTTLALAVYLIFLVRLY